MLSSMVSTSSSRSRHSSSRISSRSLLGCECSAGAKLPCCASLSARAGAARPALAYSAGAACWAGGAVAAVAACSCDIAAPSTPHAGGSCTCDGCTWLSRSDPRRSAMWHRRPGLPSGSGSDCGLIGRRQERPPWHSTHAHSHERQGKRRWIHVLEVMPLVISNEQCAWPLALVRTG